MIILDKTGPQDAWDLYHEVVEKSDESAPPMLVVEAKHEGHHLYLAELEIVDVHDVDQELRSQCAQFIEETGTEPIAALFSSECWTWLDSDESAMGEAATFLFTCTSGPEWMAESPFTRTRDRGVVWHFDQFKVYERPRGDEFNPGIAALRAFVRRNG